MTDNADELSKGEMRKICEEEGTRLSTTVPYHPADSRTNDQGTHRRSASHAA
jgi:hypothetical protein